MSSVSHHRIVKASCLVTSHLLLFACVAEAPLGDLGPELEAAPELDTVDAPGTGPVADGFPPLPHIPPTEPGFPSCAENLQGPAELSFHILQGQCVNDLCSFDYDPAGEVMTQISGSYSRQTGDFEWTVAYHPDHWRVSATVTGNGTIDGDGTESSIFTRTTVDVNGVELVEEVQLYRDNCSLQTHTFGVHEFGALMEGQFSDEFDFLREQYVSEALNFPAYMMAYGTYDQGGTDLYFKIDPYIVFEPHHSGLELSHVITPGGDNYMSFYQWNPLTQRNRSGYCEENIAGDVVCEADIDDVGEAAFAAWWYDFDGNGGGIYEIGADNCSISFVAGACSLACELSGPGDCEAFLFDG